MAEFLLEVRSLVCYHIICMHAQVPLQMSVGLTPKPKNGIYLKISNRL